MKEKKKLLNDAIKANKVQVITEESENLWEMSLAEARDIATKKSLDLMQIWENGGVVIVKMLDYWKFLYQKKKQDRKNKQKSKNPDIKTLRITFKISDHDMEVRKKQAEKFASWGHTLKLSLMLRWRENHYWDLAQTKMEQFVALVDEIYTLDWKIQRSGSNFSATLKPKK